MPANSGASPGRRPPTPAQAAARSIWNGHLGGAATTTSISAAADGLLASLRVGLGRWLGVDGYRALLLRAQADVRADHPALSELSCLGDDEAAADAALQAHGAGAIADGMMALVAAMIDLLGRIMGEEMALHLVEQSGRPLARNAARPPRVEDQNGQT